MKNEEKDQNQIESSAKPTSFFDEIEDELQCTICLDILFKPVTTECGHTFCKECLKESLAHRRQCTICREPIFPDGIITLPVNITLQKIVERKYPDKVREREALRFQKMQESIHNQNKIDGLPVVLCDQFIYPGMKTIMNIDTQQLRDLVHVLTTSATQNEEKKFILMQKYSQMQGFILNMKHIFRS